MELHIPKHWKLVPLKELVLSQKGKRPSTLRKQAFPTSLPYLDIKAIEKGIVSKYADKYSSFVVSESDLFVVWDGSRSGWIGKGKNGALGSTIMAITPVLTNQIYLYYFLSSKFEDLNKNTTGVGIPHVDSNLFWNLKIPLPPHNEQNEIAQTLDDVFYQLDYYEKRLNTIPKLLKEYRELVLTQAVSGELTEDWREENSRKYNINEEVTSILKIRKEYIKKKPLEANNTYIKEIPIDWKNISFDTILKSITAGKSFKCLERPPEKTEVGVLRVSALSWNEYLENESKTCTDKTKINPEIFVQKGDFLISRANTIDLVGACVIAKKVTKNVMLSDKTLRLDFINAKKEYVLYVLRSKIGREQIEAVATGSQESMKNISQYKIRNIVIPFPPLQEQEEIVKRVEKLLKKADKIETYYQDTKKYLEQVRKIILDKAFSGQIVNPVQEEMSVDELLEKIKTEKAIIAEQRKTARKNRKRQPKPPKMTKKILKEIVKEQFPSETFNYDKLFEVLQTKVRVDDYDELRNHLFDLLRSPLKKGDEEAFLQANFENGITFKINPIKHETENS